MPVLQQIVAWFDASMTRYWSIATAGLIGAVFLALFAAIRGTQQETRGSGMARVWRHPVLFLAMAALALTAFRWPSIFYPQPLNPDESVRVVEAMKFLHDDFMPWRSVDSGTSGPLNAYAMIPFALLGFPLDFATARLVGLVCTIATLTFTFLTLRTALNDGIARMGILPMLLFYCFTRYSDFVHYASEYLSIALLSAALYLLVNYIVSGPDRRGGLFLAGVVLGAVPFAKLQAAPVSVLLFLGGISAIAIQNRAAGTTPVRHLIAFSGGGVLVSIVLFVMLLGAGAFGDFWRSYIIGGLFFTAGPADRSVAGTAVVLVQHPEFLRYLAGSGVLVTAGLAAAAVLAYLHGRFLVQFAAACLYAAVTIFIVLSPGRVHDHYLLFMIPPTALLTGVVAGTVLVRVSEQERTKLLIACLALYVGVAVVFQLPLKSAYYRENPFVEHAGEYFAPRPWAQSDPAAAVVSDMILRIANPGEKMVIWGWAPKYFISTGLLPGTRETNTFSQIEDSPLRPYYRQRFLHDLKTARPAVFVDSVSSLGWHYCDRKQHGHETFGEVAEFIADSYTLLYEFGPTPDDAVRVYALNERLWR